MRNSIMKLLLLGLTVVITNCATPPDITQKPPGFLPNYSLLKPVAVPEDGAQLYVYKDPQVNRSDYNAGIVEPVSIYQGTTSESTVKSAEIESARRGIDEGIKEVISKKVRLTNQPGPGVFRVQVAITGATLEKDSLKPWNLIPVSLAITLASKAANLDSKKPILVVEIKITDSQSGKLLKEVVSTLDGEKFHFASYTASEFENLSKKWVEKALKYSNKSS